MSRWQSSNPNAPSGTFDRDNPNNYHRHMSEPSELKFRVAAVTDIPAIVTLVESAYRGDSGRRGWTTESDLLDGQRTDAAGVAALLDQPHGMILLAERGGVLLASCHVERQGDFGYFGMFAVDPLRQGDGLGKAVLAEAERIARDEWGCRAMHMTVIVQRAELIAFYERRGYRRTGEFQPFPYGDERFGVPRRGDLSFEVLRKAFA